MVADAGNIVLMIRSRVKDEDEWSSKSRRTPDRIQKDASGNIYLGDTE